MKAVILAAGRSTRLLPLTKNTPQCLLKLGEKTILERQVEIIQEAGIKDVCVVIGHQADKIEEYCNKKSLGYIFNPFYDVSGMALTLWIAKNELKDGAVCLYSDILFDSNIITGLLSERGDICLAVKKDGLRDEAEKVIVEEGVIKTVSKIITGNENGEFIGIAKFTQYGSEKIITEIDNMAKLRLDISFIQALDNLASKGETITAYNFSELDARFIDIDFPEDLVKAENLFLNE